MKKTLFFYTHGNISQFDHSLMQKKLYCINHIKFILILLFSIIILNVSAQKVFQVKYVSKADLKVYPVKYESQCDLKVYWVDYESQAEKDGLWFPVKYESQAQLKLYFVKYKSQADIKIYYVDYKSKAGWRKEEKVHLFRFRENIESR